MANRHRPRPKEWTLLTALCTLVLLGCSKDEIPVAALRPVLVQKVGDGNNSSPTVYSGDIRPRYESDLGFRISGKIVARLVDVGSAVKAGQALARIDPADAGLQATQAEANRALAEAEARRYRDLRAKNFVSQSALDAKETALKAAAAQAELARNQSSYTTLNADHDSVVTAVMAEVGQVVAAGQAVVRIARPEEKELVINVPEGRVGELRGATTVTVAPWARPELRLRARLRELSPAADPATRTYTARLSILDTNTDLQLGMTAQAFLSAATADGIAVPTTAVVDQGNGPAVWVVVNDKAQRRPVTIKQLREDKVILSAGVQMGETIVVAGAHKLVADQPVRPQALETAAPAPHP
jgi:RND family efflux transporter MFP subunit